MTKRQMTKVSAMGLVLVLILSFMPQTAYATGTGAGITFQPATQYKVTYNNGDGSVTSTEMHDVGSQVKVGGPLKRAEYTFSGWRYSGPATVNEKGATVGNGAVVAPGANFVMPSGDVTLTAIWTRMYAVTFHSNDGRVDSTYAVVFVPPGGRIGESNIPPDPSRANYRFVGWNLDRNGGTDRTSTIAEMTIYEDVTAYAQWRASGGTTPTPTPTPAPEPEPTPTPEPEPEPTPTPEPEPEPTPEPEPEQETEPDQTQEPLPANPQQPSDPPSNTRPPSGPQSNPPQSTGSVRPSSPSVTGQSPDLPYVLGYMYGDDPLEAAGPGQVPGLEPGQEQAAGPGSDRAAQDAAPNRSVLGPGEAGITVFDIDAMQYEEIDFPEQEFDEEYVDVYSWDVPLLEFGNLAIPLYAPKGVHYWALLNLIMGLVGVIIAAMFIMRALYRKMRSRRESQVRYFDEAKDDSGRPTESRKDKRFKLGLLAVAFVMGILGIVLFLLTQDMRNIMVLIDRWTLTHAIILAIEIVAVILSKKKNDKNDEEYQAGTDSRLPA